MVYAPKKWFGVNNKHLDTTDLMPDGWITI
jgi:hypothetical protein